MKELQFPDHFFGCKFRIRLGGVIIRRHDAGYRLTTDCSAGLPNRGDSRTPVPRPAIVGNNAKVRYHSHLTSQIRLRASYPAMSMPAERLPGPAGLAHAFDRHGR